MNLKVNPAITVTALYGVFSDELLRYVRDLDAHIFRVWHGRVKIEVFEIDGAEPCSVPREDAVKQNFYQF